MHEQALTREFFERDTARVARDLLGCRLVYQRDDTARIGMIVETEAYLGPHDKAAHSARGLTDRTRPMFGPAAHAYVYLIYGMHHCMNVVTEPEGHASAVLLRALEPLEGIHGDTRGPGRLCKAMGINRSLSGIDMTSPPLFILPPIDTFVRPKVIRRPRIGVDYAGAWARRLLRFYLEGNRWISRP